MVILNHPVKSGLSSYLHDQLIVGLNHSLQSGLVRVEYPGYRGSPDTDQNCEHSLFCPAANDWGTIHPIPNKGPTTLG
jgi:hypothetical protein